MREWEKVFHENGNKAGVAIQKAKYFKTKSITRVKEGMIKG